MSGNTLIGIGSVASFLYWLYHHRLESVCVTYDVVALALAVLFLWSEINRRSPND